MSKIKGKEMTVEDPVDGTWSPSEHTLSLLECSPKLPKNFPLRTLQKAKSLERRLQRSQERNEWKDWMMIDGKKWHQGAPYIGLEIGQRRDAEVTQLVGQEMGQHRDAVPTASRRCAVFRPGWRGLGLKLGLSSFLFWIIFKWLTSWASPWPMHGNLGLDDSF